MLGYVQKAEMHSFPLMYIMGGGLIWSSGLKKGFSPKKCNVVKSLIVSWGPKRPFLAIDTSNRSKWVGHWLDMVGHCITHPGWFVWAFGPPKKWHRVAQEI